MIVCAMGRSVEVERVVAAAPGVSLPRVGAVPVNEGALSVSTVVDEGVLSSLAVQPVVARASGDCITATGRLSWGYCAELIIFCQGVVTIVGKGSA